MKKIKSFMSFYWLSDFVFDLLDNLKNKGTIGKVCYYLLLCAGITISTFGLAGMFALNYGFIESLGIHSGGLMVIGVFVLPLGLACLFSKKPWFWTLDFIVGILTAIVFISNA